MKTQKTFVTCDCCGELTEQVAGVGDSCSHAIIHISYDVWYGGVHVIEDICPACNVKIMKFMIDNHMLDYAPRKDGVVNA